MKGMTTLFFKSIRLVHARQLRGFLPNYTKCEHKPKQEPKHNQHQSSIFNLHSSALLVGQLH